MLRIKLLFTVAVLLTFIAPVFAQDMQVASAAPSDQVSGSVVAYAPQFKPGDSWKFGQVDLWTGNISTAVRKQGWSNVFTTVSNGEVVMDGKMDDAKNDDGEIKPGKEIKNFFTLEGNVIANAKKRFSPYQPLLSFPMSVGQTFPKVEYEWSTPEGKKGTAYFVKKVVAYEKVTVPAGTFDAFKLELVGESTVTSTGGGRSPMKMVYWYAPAAKRIVRSEYYDEWNNHAYNKDGVRLESYNLAD